MRPSKSKTLARPGLSFLLCAALTSSQMSEKGQDALPQGTWSPPEEALCSPTHRSDGWVTCSVGPLRWGEILSPLLPRRKGKAGCSQVQAHRHRGEQGGLRDNVPSRQHVLPYPTNESLESGCRGSSCDYPNLSGSRKRKSSPQIVSVAQPQLSLCPLPPESTVLLPGEKREGLRGQVS